MFFYLWLFVLFTLFVVLHWVFCFVLVVSSYCLFACTVALICYLFVIFVYFMFCLRFWFGFDFYDVYLFNWLFTVCFLGWCLRSVLLVLDLICFLYLDCSLGFGFWFVISFAGWYRFAICYMLFYLCLISDAYKYWFLLFPCFVLWLLDLIVCLLVVYLLTLGFWLVLLDLRVFFVVLVFECLEPDVYCVLLFACR